MAGVGRSKKKPPQYIGFVTDPGEMEDEYILLTSWDYDLVRANQVLRVAGTVALRLKRGIVRLV